MFCTTCGADNTDTAVYCRKCGVRLENEVETRVAKRQSLGVELPISDAEDEKQIFSIQPTGKFVKAGYVLAAVAAILLVAAAAAFTSVTSMWAVILGLLLFMIPGFYHLKRKLVRYTLTESKLEIDEGLIARSTRNLPLRRIQDITVTTTIAQRLLGFGDVVIENAGEEGGRVTLKNVDSPRRYADIMMKQMTRLERSDR
jgi:membrane protein YdbS with pleckstrin-like domain